MWVHCQNECQHRSKAPLVSLEEAVKPLLNIVPKVERNVYVVQENCQNPEDGLTTDESASIMLCT
ncbi:unnamed protein product, partial [Rotaria magnacalcarata]